MSSNDTITNILGKIKRENDIILAANRFRAATNNPAVSSRADSQIRDARRNIAYFEQTLKDLQNQSSLNNGLSGLNLTGNGLPPHTGQGHNNQSGHGGMADYGMGGYSTGNGLMPPRAPYAPAGPQDRSPAKRPNYSKLGEDLTMRYDAESLTLF